MIFQNTFLLTDEYTIPGVAALHYGLDNVNHWLALGDIDIYVYGTAEAPQLERLPTAQKVIPFLAELDFRCQVELNRKFNHGVDPRDQLLALQKAEEFRKLHNLSYYTGPDDIWNPLSLYFGFTGEESIDEFLFEYDWGIWGSRYFYAGFRLNPENPLESLLLECR